jgi:hypothetical protein
MDQHVEKGEGQVTHESFKRVYSVWTGTPSTMAGFLLSSILTDAKFSICLSGTDDGKLDLQYCPLWHGL